MFQESALADIVLAVETLILRETPMQTKETLLIKFPFCLAHLS